MTLRSGLLKMQRTAIWYMHAPFTCHERLTIAGLGSLHAEGGREVEHLVRLYGRSRMTTVLVRFGARKSSHSVEQRQHG